LADGGLGAFARFLCVGGAGFVVDASLNQLLIHAGVAPLASRVPAIAAAMVFTWLANRRVTFRTGGRPALPEAMRYLAVAIAMALFNYALYGACVAAGLPPFLAVAVATATQAVVSFFGYRRFAFNAGARAHEDA
jgi:putative flippase GtrA